LCFLFYYLFIYFIGSISFVAKENKEKRCKAISKLQTQGIRNITYSWDCYTVRLKFECLNILWWSTIIALLLLLGEEQSPSVRIKYSDVEYSHIWERDIVDINQLWIIILYQLWIILMLHIYNNSDIYSQCLKYFVEMWCFELWVVYYIIRFYYINK